METMISYTIDVMKGDFINMKEMIIDTINKKKGKWYNTVDEYRNKLGITWHAIMSMDKKNLKKVIRAFDTNKWKEALEKKTCMKIYSL